MSFTTDYNGNSYMANQKKIFAPYQEGWKGVAEPVMKNLYRTEQKHLSPQEQNRADLKNEIAKLNEIISKCRTKAARETGFDAASKGRQAHQYELVATYEAKIKGIEEQMNTKVNTKVAAPIEQPTLSDRICDFLGL